MVGDRIKQLRGKESQGTFGTRFGISRNTVMRYESGDRKPDTDFIVAVCEAYNINAHWLLTGDGPEKLDQQNGLPAAKTAADPQPSDNHKPAQPTPSDDLGLGESVELLAKIYNSGNTVLVRAIAANLNAFSEAIDNKALAQQAQHELHRNAHVTHDGLAAENVRTRGDSR